jgi:hypothetical protein
VVPHDLVEVTAAHQVAAAGDTAATATATPAGTAEPAAIPATPQIDAPRIDVPRGDGQVVWAAASGASSPNAPSPAAAESQADGRHVPDDRSRRLGLPVAPGAQAQPEAIDLDRPTTHAISAEVMSPRQADEHSTASSIGGVSSEDGGSSGPPPLPQRVRLQHLAPQLREPPTPENGDACSGAGGSEAGDSAIEFTEGLLGGFRDTGPSSVASPDGDQPA